MELFIREYRKLVWVKRRMRQRRNLSQRRIYSELALVLAGIKCNWLLTLEEPPSNRPYQIIASLDSPSWEEEITHQLLSPSTQKGVSYSVSLPEFWLCMCVSWVSKAESYISVVTEKPWDWRQRCIRWHEWSGVSRCTYWSLHRVGHQSEGLGGPVGQGTQKQMRLSI